MILLLLLATVPIEVGTSVYRVDELHHERVHSWDETTCEWRCHLSQIIASDYDGPKLKVATWKLYKECHEPRYDYRTGEYVCRWSERVEIRAKVWKVSPLSATDSETLNRDVHPVELRRLGGVK